MITYTEIYAIFWETWVPWRVSLVNVTVSSVGGDNLYEHLSEQEQITYKTKALA